jgi:hypothetical protein
VSHGLRIAHVQPMSIDMLGYRDDDWGTTFCHSVNPFPHHSSFSGIGWYWGR